MNDADVFRSTARIRIAALFAALVITAVAFLPSLGSGFLKWDDATYVVDNPDIRALSPVTVKTIFTSFYVSNYQPLTMLTYAADYFFFGLDPAGYHLTNLILHVLNCALVFSLALMLSGRTFTAFFACLVFGVHPLHVESVAWIAARKDLLYCFFFLASSVAYVRYLRGKSAKTCYVFAFLFFCAAVLSKATAVSLPLALCAFDYLLGRKASWRSLADKIPFLVVAFIMGMIALAAQTASGAVVPSVLADQLIMASAAIVFYMMKLFAPLGLSCFYPWPNNSIGQLPGAFLAAPVIVAVIGLIVVFSARYVRGALFGAVFFFVTILPVLQIIPVGNVLVADRYMYLPIFGVLYLVGEALSGLWAYQGRSGLPAKTLAAAFLIAMTASFAALTWHRCAVWHDTATLFGDAIAKSPRSFILYTNRGVSYLEAGEYDKAVSDFRAAITLNPRHCYPYINLSNLYHRKGQDRKAILYACRAVKLGPTKAAAYYNLGVILSALGKEEKAAAAYKKMAELGYHAKAPSR